MIPNPDTKIRNTDARLEFRYVHKSMHIYVHQLNSRFVCLLRCGLTGTRPRSDHTKE